MTEHNESVHHAHAKEDWSAFYIPGAIVIAGIIIAGAMMVSRGGPAVAGGTQPAVAVDVTKLKTIANEAFIGKKDAPVTMVYWSDYQCPFCKKFELDVLPAIISKYVDTGKVKVVFADFPFLGSDSDDAALYARAVWDLYPDKYFAWREDMYKHQDEEGNQGFGNAGTIIKMIDQDLPSMDSAKIKARVAEKNNEYAKAIQDGIQEATANGVNGTPAVITGKQFINGAQSLATFTAALDSQLK